MELFIRNYREAVEKSHTYNINFFKYSKSVFDIGNSTNDVAKFGWPMPSNTTAVNLEISWASTIIQCLVILSDEDEMPDIVMSESVGSFMPIVDFDRVVSIANSKSEYLIIILSSILQQYNCYAMSQLEQNSKLSQQTIELLESELLHRVHWEAFASLLPDDRWQRLQLQISLPVDFQALAVAMQHRYPCEDLSAQLLFTFTDCDLGFRVPVELKLSPSLNNLLQDYKITMKFADFDPNSTSLLNYFQKVFTQFQQRIVNITTSKENRRELILILLQRHQKSIIEYDEENYKSISFLFEWNDFRFVTEVQLPEEFPHPTQPWCISLCSVYHHARTGACQPYEAKFPSPPYSPRWSLAEMADRLHAFLISNVHKFQRDSVTTAS